MRELRYLMRAFPMPQYGEGVVEMRPVLQYRCETPTNPFGGLAKHWSEWKDVPTVEETEK